MTKCLTHLRRLAAVAGIALMIAAPCAGFSTPKVSVDIREALSRPSMNHAQEGILIQSLDTGKIIYSRNSDIMFQPASNFKLLVSSASLDVLGPDYKMTTKLYATSKPDADGVMKGDIVLVGGGDPVLSFDQLQTLADKVKALGVKVIDGNIVGDASRFDNIWLGEGWNWDDEPYYYSAQVSALNASENYVDVFVRGGKKAGDPTSVVTIQATDYMTIENTCTTAAPGTAASVTIDRPDRKNVIKISGTVPAGYDNTYVDSICVNDPVIFACHTFRSMLLKDGVEVKGVPAHGTLAENSMLIGSVDSPPLSKMLALLNKPSDNLIAECLLKTLGKEIKGQGSTAAGREVVMEFLSRVGADPTAVFIVDGSGLSRKNCISPATQVKLLTYMYHHKNSEIFLSSLPIAGVDGTLKNRMKNSPAQGNVRAKTGSMTRVVCLSGFVRAGNGENLVFSFMLNNYCCTMKEAMDVQDSILKALAGSDLKAN